MKYTKHILFLLFISYLQLVNSNSDGQCCRKRIQCFECDSRYDARCGEPFNLTSSSGMMIYCDDLCVKLKHKFNGQFYYIRSCADQFKRILIKKTDVCYANRLKDGSNLCFCDQEYCNGAVSIRFNLFTSKFVIQSISILYAFLSNVNN
jgi:hypothetical protein